MSLRKIITPILVTILIYIVLGSIFIYFGTTIFNDLSAPNIIINEYAPHSVIIRNNAPFTFPFVNPSFIGSIYITGTSEKVTCSVQSVSGNIPCETTQIDLGTIDAGKQTTFYFYINPNGNNFSITMNSYLNYLIIKVNPKSSTLRCVNHGNNLASYTCEQA